MSSIAAVLLISILVVSSSSAAELSTIQSIDSTSTDVSKEEFTFEEYQDEAAAIREILGESTSSEALEDPAPGGIDDGLELWLRHDDGTFGPTGVSKYDKPTILGKNGTITSIIVFEQETFAQDKLLSYTYNGKEQLSFTVGPQLGVSKGTASLSWPVQSKKGPIHVAIVKTENIFGVTDVQFDGESLNTEGDVLVSKLNAGGTMHIGSFTTPVLEAIHYSRTLSSSELRHIESYLALKYDLVLDEAQNLISPDDSIIWDAIENSSFVNNRAGIGRSDVSELLWTVGESLDKSGTGISMESVGNLENESYLFIGDNGNTFLETESDHPAFQTKLGRIWKVDATGMFSGVKLSVHGLSNVDMEKIGLVVHDDLLTDVGILYMPVSADDDSLVFENVKLSDGQYISILTNPQVADVSGYTGSVGLQQVLGIHDVQPIGPGGITENLGMWLRAHKANVHPNGDVYAWTDESEEENDLTADLPYAFGTSPIFVENVLNNNPAIRFNSERETDYLGRDGFSLASEDHNFTLFTVARRDQTSRFEGIVSYASKIDTNDFMLFDPSGLWLFKNGNREQTSHAIDNGKSHILTVRNNELVGSTDLYVDGVGGTYNFGSQGHEPDGAFILGQDQDNVGGGFDPEQAFQGDIGEVILIHGALSDIDKLKIESYLGIKYSVTLPTLYVRSDGEVIWDNGLSEVHNKNIAGIGKDDVSGLAQMASQSGIVTVKNPTDVTNGEFLVWGESVVGADDLTGRTWYFQETGEVGKVNIIFNLKDMSDVDITKSPQFTLLLSEDDTFSQSRARVDGVVDGYTVMFEGLDIQNGEFMKLVAVE